MLAVQVFTETERRQLAQKDLARGSYSQGQSENALLILDQVLAEEMTDRVAAECWVAKAAFQIELGKFEECLETLGTAARFIDAADLLVQGAFYYQRARVHKELGNTDAAITDYSGSAALLGMAGRRDREALALNSLASLYIQIEDLQAARTTINQALAICPKGSEYECQIYDTFAQVEFADGCLTAALWAADKALSLVGENELWRALFTQTRDKIETELLEALGVQKIADLDRLRANMTRRALIATKGNLSQAATKLGLKGHKGVDWIISKHPELECYRKERTTRHKSIIKLL